MKFREEDINFDLIGHHETFEELCFDLIMKVGYQNVTWRRGGADSGRDIEAKLFLNNPIVETIEEKWFFECKYYSKGVPVDEVITKLAWAEAERANHLVIITNKYISNTTRKYIELMQDQKHFKIHLLEEKQMKKMILKYDDIIEKYFTDEITKLLNETKKNWTFHNIYPQPQIQSQLCNNLDFNKLSNSDISFLTCMNRVLDHEINEWIDGENIFSFDALHMYNSGIKADNISLLDTIEDNYIVESLNFGLSDWDIIYRSHITMKLEIDGSKAIYTFIRDDKNSGYEYYIEAKSNYPSRTNYIDNWAKTLAKKLNENILKKMKSQNPFT